MTVNEQTLIARWEDITRAEQQERQLLLRETVSFLQHLEQHDHWWCQHGELTQHFSCVLTRYDRPGQHAVQKLWQRMSEQLSSCAACVVAFHTAMASPHSLCMSLSLCSIRHVLQPPGPMFEIQTRQYKIMMPELLCEVFLLDKLAWVLKLIYAQAEVEKAPQDKFPREALAILHRLNAERLQASLAQAMAVTAGSHSSTNQNPGRASTSTQLLMQNLQQHKL